MPPALERGRSIDLLLPPLSFFKEIFFLFYLRRTRDGGRGNGEPRGSTSQPTDFFYFSCSGTETEEDAEAGEAGPEEQEREPARPAGRAEEPPS